MPDAVAEYSAVPRPHTARSRSRQRAEGVPLPFRSRRLPGFLLCLTDLLVLQASLLMGGVVCQVVCDWLGLPAGQNRYVSLMLAMFALPCAFWCMGLYPGYGINSVERVRRRTHVLSLLFLLLILWDFLLSSGDASLGTLVSTFAVAVVVGPLAEALVRRVMLACGWWGAPVVVLGAGPTGQRLVKLLHREPEVGLIPVAVFDDRMNLRGGEIESVPVLGPLSRAKTLVGQASTALVAMPDLGPDRLARLSGRLTFPKVILIPDLVGIGSLWVASRDLGGIVGLEVKRNLCERRNWAVKRAIDCAVSLPLLLLSLPVLLLFAACIKLLSPDGPVLFRHERTGFGGRTISILKLRTMRSDADQRLQDHLDADPEAREQWQRYCKLKEDPRVLPVIGPLLRRTSLDEMPQLWNVLRGEMSLVGPRPLPRYHLEQFAPSFRTLRRGVLPGLTGLWQVSARSDGDHAVQQMLDTYYIRNWSLWLDLYLLVRTVGVVVCGRGAY